MRYLAVGQHIAWAIDTSGALFMSVGINVKRESQMMNPAWVQVDALSKVSISTC